VINIKYQISNIKYQIAVAAVLILAAVLRLYRIGDYMNFLGDEGRDALVVYNILHGKLTLLGPTSSVGGFFLGPIYYYFSAPFLYLSKFDPVGPAIMVALFSIATVWLVYKMGETIFSKKVGLISAFLYAISPTVITYSRSSWNPNLMPFFTIATLLSLFLALKKRSNKLFIACGILFGILMQLHYLATFIGVIVAVYVMLWHYPNTFKNIKIIVKQYLLILVGFLIGFAPFIAFELRHSFTNSLNILN
jgi:4-amino-4-deoxy-L-arabinose transferase-like glycosyltransferase